MRKFLLCFSLCGLAACQTQHYDSDDTKALNGVWRGVVSDAAEHESLQAHVLDGLMLAVSNDGQRAHSGEFSLAQGRVQGLYAARDELGQRDEDYALNGHAWPGDSIEADLIGEHSDAALSLFFNADQTYNGASYAAIEGLYYLDTTDLQITLSIDAYGYVEGYDDAGCGYFGGLSIPDSSDNIYALTLDVEGCAMAGEFGFAIGSVKYSGGWPYLVLPVWFEAQDRVEPWILQRV